jgi:hypothetical protein
MGGRALRRLKNLVNDSYIDDINNSEHNNGIAINDKLGHDGHLDNVFPHRNDGNTNNRH